MSSDKDEKGLSFVDTVEQCSRHTKETLLGPQTFWDQEGAVWLEQRE